MDEKKNRMFSDAPTRNRIREVYLSNLAAMGKEAAQEYAENVVLSGGPGSGRTKGSGNPTAKQIAERSTLSPKLKKRYDSAMRAGGLHRDVFRGVKGQRSSQW